MSISTKIHAGAKFPDFSWPLTEGEAICPATLDGWKLLVIYRGKHCPLCMAYLAQLQALRDEFIASGITVLALSSDPVARAQETVAEQGWTFPVLAELDEGQMRTLGLYMSAPRSAEETDRNFAEPAILAIGPTGFVQVIDISNAPFARPDLRGVLNGLRFIIGNAYPIRGTAN